MPLKSCTNPCVRDRVSHVSLPLTKYMQEYFVYPYRIFKNKIVFQKEKLMLFIPDTNQSKSNTWHRKIHFFPHLQYNCILLTEVSKHSIICSIKRRESPEVIDWSNSLLLGMKLCEIAYIASTYPIWRSVTLEGMHLKHHIYQNTPYPLNIEILFKIGFYYFGGWF